MKAFEFVGGPNDGEHTMFDGPVPREVLIQDVTLTDSINGRLQSVGPLRPQSRYLLDPVAEVYRYTPAVKEPAWRSGWTMAGLFVGYNLAVIAGVASRGIGLAVSIVYVGGLSLFMLPLRWLPEWMRGTS